MGAWGIGIMQDDVAADTEIEFEDALAEGLTATEAIQRVLVDPPWPVNDYDDGPVTYMALAALQLKHNILTADIKNLAIEAATSDAAIGRFEWDGAPKDRIEARKEILRQFRRILERGTCTPEELEQVTYPKEFSLW